MTRPAIYLPSTTDEELIGFVSQYGGTELEQDLARRLTSEIDEHEGLQDDLDAELKTNVDLYDRIDALEEELKHCQ